MKLLLRGWWWMVDYLYAGWWQLRSIFRRRCPDSYAVGEPSLPAIVLLPGVYETWIFLEPAAQRLNALGYRVFSVPGLGINGRAIPESAEILARTLADLASVQGVSRCILLAHSKGGLIGKHAMLDAALTHPDDAGPTVAALARPMEILGMVAIGTPFSGSLYARYMISRTLRHFSPDDTVLLSLQAATDVNAHVVSIYSEFDPHIPGGSALPGAVNVEVPVSGHFRTLSDKTVLTAVEQAVVKLGKQP
ncbi:alpha/beta fold hydrolase [Arthrobacter glacialis]|uniref:alpha/beta fold hydrolase n=1 Tax=Arthrobacter glacialis TaxID=1664 RepID=UPI000CD3E289|nr:alpha/beta hydrolase [Arthrobacter glacialis]POH61243.1 alpha/beta hydrolase [Arthrobacter glacialis]